MVEVEVGIDDHVNCFRLDACGLQVLEQLHFRKKEAASLFRQLITDPSFDQHRLASGAHDDRVAGHGDAVLIIGLHLALPELFGDDPEESSAIAQVGSVIYGDQFKITETDSVTHGCAAVPRSSWRK
jgi:hypothetical protein